MSGELDRFYVKFPGEKNILQTEFKKIKDTFVYPSEAFAVDLNQLST